VNFESLSEYQPAALTAARKTDFNEPSQDTDANGIAAWRAGDGGSYLPAYRQIPEESLATLHGSIESRDAQLKFASFERQLEVHRAVHKADRKGSGR
jgi:hypothetical protein